MSQLILLNEAAQKDGVPLPDLVPSAQQIRQAVESLVLAGKKLVSETSDSVCLGLIVSTLQFFMLPSTQVLPSHALNLP